MVGQRNCCRRGMQFALLWLRIDYEASVVFSVNQGLTASRGAHAVLPSQSAPVAWFGQVAAARDDQRKRLSRKLITVSSAPKSSDSNSELEFKRQVQDSRLYSASGRGRTSEVERLLKEGANIEWEDPVRRRWQFEVEHAASTLLTESGCGHQPGGGRDLRVCEHPCVT